MKLIFPLMFLTLALPAFADICSNDSAPACPTSGATILDDTYPTRAYVISTRPYNDNPVSRRLPVSAALETMRAYNFNLSTMPFIIVPTTAEQFAEMTTALQADLVAQGKTAAEAQSLISERVRNAPAVPYTWQQDYFEATVDPATGNPRVNMSEVYATNLTSAPASVAAIAGANVCTLTQGSDLKSSVLGWDSERILANQTTTGQFLHPNGEFGGNMEGLPGGLCLVGNNMAQAFANQVCGSPENTVSVETSWMQVGHVDEILKVVRDRRNIPGRPAECAFNIFAADTNLGKELLQRPEFSNRNAITLNLAADIKDTDAYAGTFSTPGGEFLCDAVREAGDSIQPQSPPGSKVLQSMVRFVFPEANAIDVDAAQLRCINGVNNVTNSQLWNAMKDRAPFLEYNALIQAAMDRSKRKMYDKILERLPQCRPFFPDIASMFTPVPNLFSISPASETGSHVTSINGNRELVIGLSGANSLFPNPTNSIMMNNTLIFPGPVTTPYKSYLEEQTRRLGLTPSSVDTWDYAHTGQGNIHCSSHSIPYCSPRGRQ